MNKLLTITAAAALLAGAATAQVKTATIKQTAPVKQIAATVNAPTIGGDLVQQLPASDFVATMNFKRLLNDVLPQVLASKPDDLNKLNTGIADFKAKTGIDLREFESAAVGVNYKQTAAGKFDLEPLILMRGSFKPSALIGAVKVATDGKYKQETIAGKQAVIFTLPAVAKTGTANPKTESDGVEKMVDKLMSGEIAVLTLDNNTLAIAKPAHLRQSFGAAKTAVKADFTDFINRKPAAVLNFAGNFPSGVANAINIGNDQFGKVFDSLKQPYGTIDTNGSDAAVQLQAQTGTDVQAQELEELLNLAQSFGKGMLGSKQDPKNQALVRVIETLTISRTANRVQLDAVVPPDALSQIIK